MFQDEVQGQGIPNLVEGRARFEGPVRLTMRHNLGGRPRMQPRNIPARVQIHVRLFTASSIASFYSTARPGLTPIYCLARLLPCDVRQS